MEENSTQDGPVTFKQIALRFGTYTGFVLIIFALIVLMMDQTTNTPLSMLGYVILIAGIYMAQKNYKEAGDGFMSYKTGLKLGTLLSLVAGTLESVFTYIYLKFIDDSMIKVALDQVLDDLEAEGRSEHEIEVAMQIMETVMKPEILLPVGIAVSVFFGFIFSLLLSALNKRTDPNQPAA